MLRDLAARSGARGPDTLVVKTRGQGWRRRRAARVLAMEHSFRFSYDLPFIGTSRRPLASSQTPPSPNPKDVHPTGSKK